jgi:hypothetical protein
LLLSHGRADPEMIHILNVTSLAEKAHSSFNIITIVTFIQPVLSWKPLADSKMNITKLSRLLSLLPDAIRAALAFGFEWDEQERIPLAEEHRFSIIRPFCCLQLISGRISRLLGHTDHCEQKQQFLLSE